MQALLLQRFTVCVNDSDKSVDRVDAMLRQELLGQAGKPSSGNVGSGANE
jgi:hypothetical protein